MNQLERATKLAEQLARVGFDPSIDVRMTENGIAEGIVTLNVKELDFAKFKTLAKFFDDFADEPMDLELGASELTLRVTPE
jgi:hypothetical protein